MINVVIASRLLVVREGMKRILGVSGDIAIVAEIESLHELGCSEKFSTAHILVIANYATRDKQNFLGDIRNTCPWLQIVVITHTPSLLDIVAALRYGTRGLLSADCAANHLPAAVRAVASGRVYIQDNMSHVIAKDLQGLDRDHTHKSLTQREMEIFMKLAVGLKVTEIASQLGISVKTVSTHKGRMMEKMGITSFSQLVRYAMANGLFDSGGHLA